MTTRKQCQFWDCEETIRRGQFLCYSHYTDYKAGMINQCPECGKYKDGKYSICKACYEQSTGKPSPPFANTRLRNDRLPMGQTHMTKAHLIQQSGKYCQGCGWQAPKNIHEHTLARQDGTFELDHKLPKKRGGTNDLSNLWVLCLPCHDGKTAGSKNMTAEEWIAAGRPKDWSRKNLNMQKRQSRR